MGDVLLGADSGNPKGYWEDRDFLELNRTILRDAGGSWHRPPPEENILKLKVKYELSIKKLISARKKYPI